MTMEILGEGSYRSARCGRRLEEVVATSVFDDGDVWFGIHLRSDNWDIHRMSQNCKKILNWYGYIFRDGFVVGAGFWGFVGSSWQQMFIFCTVMPSYACCQRYCCKISSIWYIYIYAYLKNFIQLGHKKQNILHMHSEKLHNAINGSMSFSQWISERKIQFCPVAPCSNDRVLFASMLQVFIANMNKRKQHFWLTEDFILSPSSTASSRAPYIKRYGMFCQGKHIVPLKNVVLLNPSTASTQILRAESGWVWCDLQ